MKNVSDDKEIIEAFNAGKNIFITGKGGSGKTYLAKQFAKKPGTIITSTTGISSIIVGGETIHRFLGLGINSRPEFVQKILAKWSGWIKSSSIYEKRRVSTVQNLNTLIIDEVSMLRRDTFEVIDLVLSHIRDNPYIPFGSLRLVLVGDFLQLNPVVTHSDLKSFPDLSDPFAFQSSLWGSANFECFNLTSNYRQVDEDFLRVLDKVRFGYIDDEVLDVLNSRVNVKLDVPMDPIKLFPYNVDVYRENMRCISRLPGDKILSTAEAHGKNDYFMEVMLKESPCEEKLYFCKDAQVVMLTNNGDTWVNGSMGIVRSINPVRIQLANGNLVTVSYHKWEKKINHLDPASGYVVSDTVATIEQYPFKLAYATSIHKSQGLEFNYVDLDLSNCFSPGQAYVALSRCKTLSGLCLRGFNKKSIMADDRVVKFYLF